MKLIRNWINMLLCYFSFFQTQNNIVLSAEETQTLLQIFIPVSFIVTLLTILILVFARKTQLCQRKKKRKDVIIRNNEDIQLLDRMNFVNKNPTYFMTSQDKSEEKKISIKEIPYERVKIIETVGEGAFGHVYKGISFLKLPNVHLHVWLLIASFIITHGSKWYANVKGFLSHFVRRISLENFYDESFT